MRIYLPSVVFKLPENMHVAYVQGDKRAEVPE